MGVALAAPLGDRVVIDGATGRRPDDIDDFDYVERNAREEVLGMDTTARES